MTTAGSSVRVDRVEPADPLPEMLAELSLDRPAAGGEWSGVSFEVSGRVLGRWRSPERVEVLHDGRLLRSLPVLAAPEGPRAASGGEAPGGRTFSGMVSTVGLPLELDLEVVLAFGDGARSPVARLAGTRTPLRLDYEPELQPLMVTTLDQMGSARLMGLLAAHPQIVALRRWPYECAAAAFWLQVLVTLTAPAVEASGTGIAGIEPHHVDGNPYFAPDLVREPRPGVGLYSERLAETCQRNIDGWYAELAHHQVKEEARYFTEKLAPGPLQARMRELYPEAGEVFLVRDPRDRRAATPGRNARRDPGVPGQPVLSRPALSVFDLYREWEARREFACLVRYEDLLRRPAATLERLFDHLGVDASPDRIEAAVREAEMESQGNRPPRGAAVSPEPAGGRPAADLPAAMRELFADVLREFGYEPGTSAEHVAVAGAAESGAGARSRPRGGR